MLHAMSPLRPVLPAQPVRHAAPPAQPFSQSAGTSEGSTAQGLAGPAQALRGTAGMVIQVLQQAFGNTMGEAIARELGLDPASSPPMQAWEVDRALGIGQTARSALQGVDFGSRLVHSARADGPGFRRVSESVGLDPRHIDDSTRREIDARMDAKFNQATAAGQAPVPLTQVREWLQKELIRLTK